MENEELVAEVKVEEVTFSWKIEGSMKLPEPLGVIHLIISDMDDRVDMIPLTDTNQLEYQSDVIQMYPGKYACQMALGREVLLPTKPVIIDKAEGKTTVCVY